MSSPIYQFAADTSSPSWADVSKESYDEYVSRGTWLTRIVYAATVVERQPVAWLVTDIHGQKKALRAGAEGIERHRNSGSTLVPLFDHPPSQVVVSEDWYTDECGNLRYRPEEDKSAPVAVAAELADTLQQFCEMNESDYAVRGGMSYRWQPLMDRARRTRQGQGAESMSRTPRWTDAQLDEAESLRAKGEKWIVVEAIMGEGIKNACDYRRLRNGDPPICNCNQGRLPCTCKPDAWLIKSDAEARTALTEHEANEALCEIPGATKHALFLRDSR